MVGGYDFTKNAFNLATQAERQPGLAFKVFDLAVGLKDGETANSTFLSKPFVYTQQAVPFGDFSVHNDEGGYAYAKIPLYEALELSDNSVFSRLGLYVDGESNIAALAHDFGVSTTISINPSMVIGGLQIGVTPLDMAHAYETIANDGQLTYGSLSTDSCAGGYVPKWLGTAPAPDSCPGPVGIDDHPEPRPGQAQHHRDRARLPPQPGPRGDRDDEGRAEPDRHRRGRGDPGRHRLGQDGHDPNYADAWFVGSTAASGSVPGMTVAVGSATRTATARWHTPMVASPSTAAPTRR